jgi:tRNA/rRNA methyltransferase
MRAEIQESMQALLSRVAIVLVAPKYPENVGAAARVAMNMGISRLILVSDALPDRSRMEKMATHNAAHLIASLEHHQQLATALAPFACVVGTTARQGRQRRAVVGPGEMVAAVLPMLANNPVALVFGPEDRGLTNQDLNLCTLFTTIPTLDFSSLNLAQAVAIITYELASGLRRQLEEPEPWDWAPQQATSRELEEMYAHVGEMLCTVGFLREQDKDDGYWMRAVRQFLARLGLRSREVRNIRGFCRQFLWYDRQQRRQGIAGPPNRPKQP